MLFALGMAIGLADVVHAAHVRVCDLPRDADFVPESRQLARVRAEQVAEQLRAMIRPVRGVWDSSSSTDLSDAQLDVLHAVARSGVTVIPLKVRITASRR